MHFPHLYLQYGKTHAWKNFYSISSNVLFSEYVWVLSRQKTLEDATKQNLYKILDDNKIDRTGLSATKQDCS